MSGNNGINLRQVDYDLHGLVGIRLADASPVEAAAMERQLGLVEGSFAGEPEIIIRFVDKVPTSSPIRYLGLDDVGFTDDAFFMIRGRHKHRALMQVSFNEIGEQCTIVCERGLATVPLLIPILNLTMLSQGVVPLHATAFNYNGVGILTTGWSKSGKTETLLTFMANGAKYVGDEWIYLSRDGQHVYGLPRPVTLWEWHLPELNRYSALIPRAERVRLDTLRTLLQVIDWAVQHGTGRGSYLAGVMDWIYPELKRRLATKLSPQKLFGNEVGPQEGTADKIFFIANHELPGVTVQPMDPQKIAERMAYSAKYERRYFMSFYQKFKFAFPGVANGFIERAEELEREGLREALAHKEAYGVYHPYPVSMSALFEAISPFCE